MEDGEGIMDLIHAAEFTGQARPPPYADKHHSTQCALIRTLLDDITKKYEGVEELMFASPGLSKHTQEWQKRTIFGWVGHTT
jgi:hypothetical protein